MKGAGMLVVSPGGVNFDFWSLFGFSGKTPILFAVKVSFRVAFRGQKSLRPAQIGLLEGFSP